jgi:hypothetical protein
VTGLRPLIARIRFAAFTLTALTLTASRFTTFTTVLPILAPITSIHSLDYLRVPAWIPCPPGSLETAHS